MEWNQKPTVDCEKNKSASLTIKFSHELSLKPPPSSHRPIVFFPRRLISGRSFRANQRERIDRSLPSTRVFPAPAYVFVLTIFPAMHMENPIRRAETRKTCNNRREMRDVALNAFSRTRTSRSASIACTENAAALCSSIARAVALH